MLIQRRLDPRTRFAIGAVPKTCESRTPSEPSAGDKLKSLGRPTPNFGFVPRVHITILPGTHRSKRRGGQNHTRRRGARRQQRAGFTLPASHAFCLLAHSQLQGSGLKHQRRSAAVTDRVAVLAVCKLRPGKAREASKRDQQSKCASPQERGRSHLLSNSRPCSQGAGRAVQQSSEHEVHGRQKRETQERIRANQSLVRALPVRRCLPFA
jgi:hypothetical protein